MFPTSMIPTRESPSTPETDGPRLSGRTAVVTGSSGGIGRAVAIELAAAGAAVLVHGHSHPQWAEQTAGEVAARGVDAKIEILDLADPASQDALVERAWQWRPIDVWINIAGADVLTGPAADWPFDRKLATLWQVDVEATIRLSRNVGRRMKTRGEGVILNMGWDRAAYGMAGESGEMFAAVKGAVMSFSRSLARSLAPEVRVNCLAPGWIKTAWGETASPTRQERAADDALAGRWGTPDDVARVARFLASDAASFVTGQVVEINGGLRFP
jgi:3-oxoacyl-[acyl-carrier protein] reductase